MYTCHQLQFSGARLGNGYFHSKIDILELLLLCPAQTWPVLSRSQQHVKGDVYFPTALHLTQKHSTGLETTKRRAIRMRREGKAHWSSWDGKEASVQACSCAAPGGWEREAIVCSVMWLWPTSILTQCGGRHRGNERGNFVTDRVSKLGKSLPQGPVSVQNSERLRNQTSKWKRNLLRAT